MRILLLAFELESFSLCKLAKRFQKNGHKVKIVNCDYYNFIDDSSIEEYYQKQKFDAWENFSNKYRYLYKNNSTVDWEYLREFESKRCVNKNIQQLLMSDPVLARHHHNRDPYYTSFESKEQRYYWAELQIRWLSNILDDFNPDLLFTIKRTYFIKNIAAQIAMSTDLPMLTLIRSRLENRCHLVDNFGYGTEDRAQQYIEDTYSESNLAPARQKIESFQTQTDQSLYDANSQQKIADGDLYSTTDVVKFLFERAAKVGSKIALRKKRKYRRGFFKGNYFNSHWPNVIYHYSRIGYNRLKYVHRNPFEQQIPDRPFIYYPLHTLPESSTLTLSTEYFEGDLIRHLAKECPAGIEVVVKENPNMVGVRPFDFYEEMKAIPNVRLLDPTVSSKRLIRESRGVCGISGTALLEAAMLDTPTHTFGHPEFESVLSYSGYDGVKPFLAECDVALDDKSDDVAKYVMYLLETSVELPLREMRTQPESQQFKDGVDTMYNLLRSEIDQRGYS